MILTSEERRKNYYDQEEWVIEKKQKLAGKKRYIEQNIPKTVKTECGEGFDCSELLMKAAVRRIEKGNLSKTCKVIGLLIEHIVEEFGWHCIVQKVSKEFDCKENIFQIECEFTSFSDKEKIELEKATADIKKILLDTWKKTSEEEVEELAKKSALLNARKNIEETLLKKIKAKFLIDIRFDSPPQR